MNASKTDFSAVSELVKAGRVVRIEPMAHESPYQFANRLAQAIQADKAKRRRALGARVLVSAALAACGISFF